MTRPLPKTAKKATKPYKTTQSTYSEVFSTCNTTSSSVVSLFMDYRLSILLYILAKGENLMGLHGIEAAELSLTLNPGKPYPWPAPE
uniref:Uncharacterized protein n=1 Tax=Romanomermis culicivorax TaxID=13658 RepID=A0A915HEE9_ROMCU